jgi:hypothetical protein
MNLRWRTGALQSLLVVMMLLLSACNTGTATDTTTGATGPEPDATPVAEETPTATPAVEATPTATRTPEATVTPTPEVEATPTATPTPEATPAVEVEEAIAQAVNGWLEDNAPAMASNVAVEVVATAENFARVLVTPDDPGAADPAAAYLEEQDGEWSVLSLGTAFDPAFYEEYGIPEELWLD